MCALVASFAASDALHTYTKTLESFRDWQGKHLKRYSDEDEETRRYEQWAQNFDAVEHHNARYHRGETSFFLGMNIFADMSNEEYKSKMLGKYQYGARSSQALGTFEGGTVPSSDLPTNWSWVEQGIVPPVKDQGQCGSCWAFSAVAAMEGAYNFRNKNGNGSSACTSKCGPQNVSCCSFSEQQVADCTRGGKDTCDKGGEPHDGIMNIVNRGVIATESEYPYVSGKTGKLTQCSVPGNPVSVDFKGYVNVTQGDEAALTEAIAKQPVISIGIDAHSFEFQLYSGGIYDATDCGNKPKDLDHGVSIVGYGEGKPTPPGPTPPPPGPADCEDNHYKQPCLAEKGCFWCSDGHISYCLNVPCGNSLARSAPKNEKYYTIRNSWGTSWGVGGYIFFARDANNLCGVATDAVYVV